jgi:D-alanine--D-alanine ligase
MHILVLEGGDSSEREVSLRSAQSVASALINLGHKVTQYDTADGFGGIKDHISDVDIVFPILHGIGGEDGSVQRVLKDLQIPYLGAIADVSRVCFDKLATKEIATKQGMKTPSFEVVTSNTFMQSDLLDIPLRFKTDTRWIEHRHVYYSITSERNRKRAGSDAQCARSAYANTSRGTD